MKVSTEQSARTGTVLRSKNVTRSRDVAHPPFDGVILCDRTLLLKIASRAMRKQIVETIMRERETAAQICETFGNQEAANAIRCQPEPKFVNPAGKVKGAKG